MDYFLLFIQKLEARNFSDNTIRVYKSYIKPYLCYLDSLQISPEDASYQHQRDFLLHIQSERNLSDRTMNMIISYLQFFRLYVLHKEWDKTQIPFRVFHTYLPFVPSPTQISRFLSAMTNPKVKLAVCILYATGLRLSELCHLQCSDIMHSTGKIYVRHSKNHSDRYVPLPESIWNMILIYWKSLPKEKRPRQWLFTQQRRLDKPMDKQWIQKQILVHRQSLGMDERFCAHSLRHAYATNCYENGMDLLTLKTYLGHNSINSTCIYVKLGVSSNSDFVSPFDRLEVGDTHA